jgi:hypothetical protein
MAARFGWAFSLALVLAAPAAAQTSIILENFNVDEGKFTWAPTDSGSTTNIAPVTSTANQVTTMALEGAGSQELVLNATTPDTAARLRHVAGAGATANNIPFSTGPETDGWIGFALKTDAPGWTASLFIELAPNQAGNPGGVNNNAGIPKDVIADGQWHFYEWNLDNFDGTNGDGNGWTTVSGIIAGTQTVADGNHTVDSIILRNAAVPAASTIYIDFLAVNRLGSIADLLVSGPEDNADFDSDSDVDGADFLIWQRGFGQPGDRADGNANPSVDGNVDAADLAVWRTQFGPGAPASIATSAVPEPTCTALLAAIALASLAASRRA